MLTPEQMEGVGQGSDDEFSKFELALLVAAAHAFLHSGGSAGTVAALRGQLNQISARYSDRLERAVRNDYRAAYAASFAEDVASAGASPAVAVSFARNQPSAAIAARQAAEVAARESARAFSVAGIRWRMVESTAQDYVRRVAQHAADLAYTGAGYNAAIGEAVSAMAREGVTAFEYVRKDGVKVRVPADVYVRQRVRTEVNAKCTRQTLRTAEAVGCLVEVSTHAGCRESHAPWEGGLYQLKGEGPHRNFYKATMYVGGPYADWVEGLGGYNCYHQSRCCHGEKDRRYKDDPLEGTGYTREEVYAARSQQRAMENDIRRLKHQGEVLETSGLDAHDANVRLNAKRAELRAHVERHKAVLSRDRWREQVPGGRSYNAVAGVSAQERGTRGMTKAITLDDMADAIYGTEIMPEVGEAIFTALKANENASTHFFSEVKAVSIPAEDGKAVIFQTEPVYAGRTCWSKLLMNADELGGQTVQQLDARFAASRTTIANTLEEGVIHEIGHAKVIHGRSVAEIETLYDDLDGSGVPGISLVADSDGAEAIAETEVLLWRGDEVSPDAERLYNRVVERG